MTDKERAEQEREKFRRLPPRITPEQMVPLQTVSQPTQEPSAGTEDEWRIRMGGAG